MRWVRRLLELLALLLLLAWLGVLGYVSCQTRLTQVIDAALKEKARGVRR